jgi:hypothetical protein
MNPGNISPVDLNDHDTIYGTINIQIEKRAPYLRDMWEFKRADFTAFRQELEESNWDECFISDDANIACEAWTEKFLNTAKKHVPRKRVLVRPNSQPWYTNNLRKMARDKHRARLKAQRTKTEDDWVTYRRARNDYKIQTNLARENYDNKIVNELANSALINPKKWWDLTKKVLGIARTQIPSMLYNGEVLTSDKDKAQAFNETYLRSSTLEDEHKQLPEDPDPPEEQSHIEDFDITEQEVIDILKGINPNKAYGPDGISPRLLREAGRSIASSLARLFNLSLRTGIFPAIWKQANVLPIFKKDDPGTTTNYRPVSLLSRLSTIFERIVFKHLFNYFREHFLISIWQSGFLPGTSTVTQLIELYDQFCKAIDDRKEVRIIFLDISKAFDRVWHRGLLHKLRKCGIRGRLLVWLTDYLKDRQQRVVINGQVSDWGRVGAGVPQGSVLGPLLFLIFINDLTHVIRHCEIRLFADDTCLFIEVNDPTETHNQLQADLEYIQKWSEDWLVNFSPAKSKELILSLKRNKPDHPPVNLDNHPIQRVNSHKHLGVSITSDLKWTAQVMDMAKKACKQLNVLRPLKHSLDRSTLEKLYFAFVRSKLEYADILWDIPNPIDRSLDILESVQVDAARLVTGAISRSSVVKLYGELSWAPLAERRRQHRLVQFYKIVNKQAPVYLLALLPAQVHERTIYHLRNQGNIDVPLARLNRYLYSFFPATIRDWNQLLPSIKDAPSTNAFKARLTKSQGKPPVYYSFGERRWAAHHTRLRLNCSLLNEDLCNKMFVIPSPACICGHPSEDAYHFFYHCPRYAHLRHQFLQSLSLNGPLSYRTLLFGNTDLPVEENTRIFKIIHCFIRDSDRFI